MQNEDIPISDPTPDLSPTAARILEAAKRVLARDGFRSLTFESIALEAGENQASIRYHFRTKAGVITALVDSVLYLEAVELIEALSAVPAGAERGKALLHVDRDAARDLEACRMFHELVPAVVRSDELREHFRTMMEWYRQLDTWALAPSDDPGWSERLQPLAMLTLAIADGVGLQVQADPDLDITAAYELWATLVSGYLGSLTAVDA